MVTKKALVLVQGISSKNGYLYNTVNKYPDLVTSFDLIQEVNTERFFDEKKSWWMKLLGKLGDQLGDIWTYYTKNDARKDVCRAVRETIQDLQAKGFEVTVLAHSLGTLITLCCGPQNPGGRITVSHTVLMNSPLGINNLLARMKTNGHTERYSVNFETNMLEYVYSEEDFVSAILRARTMNLVQSKAFNPVSFINTGLGHSSRKSLNYIREERGILHG